MSDGNGSGRSDLKYDRVCESNRSEFERLLASLFPVHYPNSFAKDVIKADGPFEAFLVTRGLEKSPCGCLTWRKIDKNGIAELLNFGVLVLRRELGIGSQMLEWFLTKLKQGHEGHLKAVQLQVQSDNETAIKFYSKRGFAIEGEVANYYKRLKCPNAKLMRYEFQ